MSAFSFFKPANGLWKDMKIAKVHSRILQRLTDLPQEVRKDKHNMELLSLVCNMIENSGIENGKRKNNTLKIDKKSLLVQIYSSLFGNISPADCELLNKNIDFLIDNNHVKRLASWKMTAMGIAEWFKRKVLWIFKLIKNKVIEYIQDYLVNQFLKSTKASRIVVLAVNAAMSFDAMYIIRTILSYYGMAKFMNVLFLLSMIVWASQYKLALYPVRNWI